MKRFFVFILFISMAKFVFATPHKHPEKVYVGVYLNDISGFDTKEGRFKADLYIWLKWLGSDTIPQFSISNAEIDSKELISRESDHNWHSARWRLQGTFRGNFPLVDFPFDEQQIAINIDMPVEGGELIPDQAASGMSKQFSITGWVYKPFFKVKRLSKTYASDLGSIDHEGVGQAVHSVQYKLKLDRPFSANFIKLIIPLMIILIMASLAFYLTSDQLVVRNSMVVTALLTCVAFHFSQAESLPDVSYLVAAEKFFLWSYSLILLALVGVVFSHRLYIKSSNKSKLTDKLFRVLIPTLAIFGGLQITTSHKTTTIDETVVVQSTRPIIKSAQDTLRKAVPILPNLTDSHNEFLCMRGLFVIGNNGEKVPHLVTKVPDMTNDFIRLLADGGISVKWHLKPNLKWADGSPITAEDLSFSLTCVNDPNRKSITKVDDQTIEVEYVKRLNNVIQNFPIYPERYFKRIYKEGGLDSINYVINYCPPPMDGPYILDTFVVNDFARFKVNPNFAGNTPRISCIEVKVYKENDTWMSPQQIMKDRHADLISLLSKNSYSSLNAVSNTKLQIDSLSNNIFLLQPDLTHPLLKNDTIRQAISYAIDRQRIIDEIDGGAGISNVSSYNYQFEGVAYHYNPQKAKALIASLATTDRNLLLQGYSRGAGAPEQIILDIIIKNLEDIGIDVQFQKLKSANDVNELLLQKNHQSLLYYEGSKEDLGLFWNVPYNQTFGKYDMHHTHHEYNKEALKIYRKYEGSLFNERRSSLAKKLEYIYAQKLPTIPIFSISYRSAYHKNIVGWQPMSGDKTNIWWNVEDLYFKK